MKVCCIESLYHTTEKESYYVGGRRRRIRTAIQAPKASVLPLHYVLYMVPGAGFGPATSALSARCTTTVLPRYKQGR